MSNRYFIDFSTQYAYVERNSILLKFFKSVIDVLYLQLKHGNQNTCGTIHNNDN